MDWYRGTTVTAPGKPARSDGSKLRRKLQRLVNPQRPRQPSETNTKRHTVVGTISSEAKPDKNTSIIKAPAPRPKSYLPIDLDDGNRLEHIRKSELLNRDDAKLITQEPKPSTTDCIPELAHLKSNSPTSETIPTAPSSTRASSRTGMRRKAKTPVLRVGQLEGLPAHNQPVMRKIPSIELIAESYRALLDSRCSILRTPEPCIPELSESDEPEVNREYDCGSLNHRLKTMGEISDLSPIPVCSPSSSDETLVAFEEDTSFSKPISHTPELAPTSPLSPGVSESFFTPSSSPSQSPSLQICLDLLTRELSSAASGSAVRPSSETSALQIWVMIEAYERLRDRVSGMQFGDVQAHLIQNMFDVWLKALYGIHEKMTRNDDGQMSGSDYGALEEEELD